MSQTLSSKQRLLLAMTGQTPDRVPCTPDISNMVPCRLTGKTFEQIYLYSNPFLGDAYLSAVRQLGIDGWYPYWWPRTIKDNAEAVTDRKSLERRPDGSIDEHVVIDTPAGQLTRATRYFPDNPPAPIEKPIKDLQRDLPAWMACQGNVLDVDVSNFAEVYARVGDSSICGPSVAVGGLQDFEMAVEGGINSAVMYAYDCPELIDELMDREHRNTLRYLECVLSKTRPKPDFVLLGASGLWLFNGEAFFRRWALPRIQAITKLCKQAGVPTMLHSCGRSRPMLDILADETDLDCFNPLEIPPMGDCDLSEVKRSLGGRLALMGNLHTTDTMLRGSVEQVKQASRQAIADAAPGGGFILSTGDQCGRDTPLENLRAMVEVCKEDGKY